MEKREADILIYMISQEASILIFFKDQNRIENQQFNLFRNLIKQSINQSITNYLSISTNNNNQKKRNSNNYILKQTITLLCIYSCMHTHKYINQQTIKSTKQ
ncbi:hypothetical protein ABPG74_017514 [Tetrahymena malaccensis]